jgi:hypothetical protein
VIYRPVFYIVLCTTLWGPAIFLRSYPICGCHADRVVLHSLAISDLVDWMTANYVRDEAALKERAF